ncbi:MAG: hypothetical protein H6891_13865 [Brucellaceae bacterium]|nr:hypothetical protein [Brucellaceae bacterium]
MHPLHPRTGSLSNLGSTGAIILTLILLYNAGIWTRSFVFPAANAMPLRKQRQHLDGLIAMSIYGRSAVPLLRDGASPTFLYDWCLVAGNVMVLGMMARETLEN